MSILAFVCAIIKEYLCGEGAATSSALDAAYGSNCFCECQPSHYLCTSEPRDLNYKLMKQEEVFEMFERVKALELGWEKAYFYMGRYYDLLLGEFRRQATPEQAWGAGYLNFLPYVLTNYGGALAHGHRYIFHSMPRLLTLWLDFGSSVPTDKKSKPSDPKTHKACHFCTSRRLSHFSLGWLICFD